MNLLHGVGFDLLMFAVFIKMMRTIAFFMGGTVGYIESI